MSHKRGWNEIELDRELDGEFVKEQSITKLIILEEPKIPDNGFNSTVKTRVQCNDKKESIGIWTLNKQSKNALIDKFGSDSIKMVGKEIPVTHESYGRGKFTINVNKTELDKKQTVIAK